MNHSARRRPGSPAFAKALLRDERGIASIEFAFVGIIAMILFIGTVEIALEMIADASVQAAAQVASRVGLTTTAPTSGTRSQEAQAKVESILGGWRNVGATIAVTEQNYGSYGYNNVANASYAPTSDMGGYGDVVVYNIQLKMPGITGVPKLFGISQLTFERNYIVLNEK
ncbi:MULTISPECIES: pilus assembly protein [unclassified Caballeronia]|uniref:TadE/TadG family type IV pilus assembly protein n=1 Tax=unclassified Caballeronia TaxID=2646786 RepID=UPI0028661B82|nr:MULTISPECIES: pilus assembly protein [unclassified Caballeronia]MDR5818215.1 pilus assembly protein [Caballeronia sp. LZ033]MDR5825182.1 pilus assembly protein [Caballeronia sp. LZ043]